MFDQINGLPVHALVIHAAVVFVPLLAVAAVVYAFVPRWRAKVGWATILLAVAAPVTAFVAKQSGAELHDRLVANGMSGPPLTKIEEHAGFGTMTFYFSLALAVATLILVFLTLRPAERSLPRVADLLLGVVMLALAAVSGYYVFKTGDTGAQAVWGTSS
ncbi:DUF2231 domain-containing protein [Actinoplanes sp. NPDC051859]|uniref:DUF2231 domain-containing protein n=1 Tax=Actinoplanes sp. NPDC051859 TaxID=3363909 RepID=UPI0037951414